MVVIPEEALLEAISELLMERLPKELLAIEEGCGDGLRLEPLRYAGSDKGMPIGLGMPYALITILEADYSEKDRIIRNTVYSVKIQVKLADYMLIWRYYLGIEESIKVKEPDNHQITVEKKTLTGDIWVKIIVEK